MKNEIFFLDKGNEMDRLVTVEMKEFITQARTTRSKPHQSWSGQIIKITGSAIPWLIIAGLLWAGFFIKPKPVGSTVLPPVIERRDFFFGIAVPTPGVLWIAGTNGKIVRSEDSGANWKLQPVASKVHLQDIAAWDAQNAVAVGNQGVVVVTSDGGATWVEVPAPKSMVANKLMRVLAMPQGQAWAVGEMGAILKSIDSGKSWQRKLKEEDVGWNDVAFVDANNGWVAGEFGRVLRTVDGGTNWTASQTPVKSSLMGIAFRDSLNGVAVGLDGSVLVSSDGGASWLLSTSGTHEHLFSIAWDDKNSQWMAGGNQGVWVRGSADAKTWTADRLDERDLSWHTKVVVADGNYYFSGNNVGIWDGKSWQVVSSRSQSAIATELQPDLGRSNQASTLKAQ